MNGLNEIKDKVQRAALNKWYLAGCRGTFEMATGVGKSRTGVLAAAYIVHYRPLARILIITPTQTIRDEAWVAEFKLWGYEHLLGSTVIIECIHTVWKWKNEHFDLVIADEVHNYLPPPEATEFKHFQFFMNNTYDSILCLSASIEESLKPRLNQLAPIVDSITTEEACEMGLISPYEVYNLAIDLTPKERHDYDQADKVFQETFSIFTDYRGIRSLAVLFKCLNPHYFKHFCASRGYTPEEYAGIKRWPLMCQQAMKARKDIIYNAENKIYAIQRIVELFPEHRGIVFSQSTDFANSVSHALGSDIAHSFHSKLSKKMREAKIKDFNDLTTSSRILSAATALNEGANLVEVSLSIIASGTSKAKDFVQRLGRSVRLGKDGKLALMVRLYVRGTQEEAWVESSQIMFVGSYIDYPEQIGNLDYIIPKPSIEVPDNFYNLDEID